MSPSIKPEDIIMYYRLEKDYDLLDPVVLKVKDTVQVRRVVAKAGDTVISLQRTSCQWVTANRAGKGFCQWRSVTL